MIVAIVMLAIAIAVTTMMVVAPKMSKMECCQAFDETSATYRMGNTLIDLWCAGVEAQGQYDGSQHWSDKEVLMNIDRRYRKLALWVNLRAIEKYGHDIEPQAFISVKPTRRGYRIEMRGKTTALTTKNKWQAINTATLLYMTEIYDAR